MGLFLPLWSTSWPRRSWGADMCRRKCIYRTETMGCNYSVYNDKTRLIQVYKRLGVNSLTPEAKELMRPRNCLFCVPGKRMRQPPKAISLDGSRPRKNKRRLSFNEEAAKALYDQGANDREIGDAVGTSARVICEWRKRRGLPSTYRSKIHGKV